MQWYFVAALLTILTSSQGILTKLSQNKDSTYDYDTATVPFLGEIFKLLVSCFFLWREKLASPTPLKITKEWRSMQLFLVPSVIYLFHNNITFLTLKYLSPSTYQIMGNLKIITTGILFRIFLKRKLTKLQWIAILLLTIGTTTSQVKGCGDSMCESLLSGNITGYILAIVSAFLSAFGGVYTEYLLKKNNDSLYWQNIQLYTCGVFINMGWLIVGDFQSGFEKGFWWQRLFHGYTLTAWLVVANLASSGLLVSWLMKYADNIVKVYATSMAMLLTAVLSQFLFDVKATIQLLLGIIICMISLHLYFTPVHMLVDLPEIETPVRREEDP
ncbi:CMP-sialic acid transporter 1-like isoform X1 [Carex littledalei]|uniref:CMP-sialic acid transporter 1-like isoform X1 n=1 Tax=Carex littledalei TaxID=544730 RepID=A0A833RID4_9POAL|nr:CMP-sialic acid transporter 1-like isoform X1 [Carex littledalei]